MMDINKEAFEEAMNQGHTAFWDMNWDEAERHYRIALTLIPEHRSAISYLGLSLMEKENFPEALECYKKTHELQPEDPIQVVKLSEVYERTGEIEKAIEYCFTASDLFIQANNRKDGVENLIRVITLDPENLTVRQRLAEIYEVSGEIQNTIGQLLAIAAIHQHEGNLNLAVRTVTKALKLKPDSPEAVTALANIRDHKRLTLPVIKKAPRADHPSMFEIDEDRISDGEAPKLTPLEEALNLAVSNLAEYLFKENTYFGLDTKPSLKNIIEDERGETEVQKKNQMIKHLSQALEYQEVKEFERALDPLERAVEYGLDLPSAHYLLGVLYASNTQNKKALSRFRKTAQIPEYNLASLIFMSRINQEEQNTSTAIENSLNALLLSEKLINPDLNPEKIGRSYQKLLTIRAPAWDENVQERLFNNLNSIFMSPDWLDQLSQARKLVGNESSDEMFIPLIEIMLEPGSKQLVDSLYKINQLTADHKFRSAVELAFQNLSKAPTYLNLHSAMAEALLADGKVDQAIEKFCLIGRMHFASGNRPRAMHIYEKILSINPVNDYPRKQLIAQLDGIEDHQGALSAYADLVDMYIDTSQLDTAKEVCVDATRYAKDHELDQIWGKVFRKKLVDIYLHLLDWNLAVVTLEHIVKNDPTDIESLRSLIKLLVQTDQEEKALDMLENQIVRFKMESKGDLIGDFLENLVKENPEYLPMRRRTADYYKDRQEFDKAKKHLDEIGRILMKSGDRNGAALVIEEILALNPPHAEMYASYLMKLRGESD